VSSYCESAPGHEYHGPYHDKEYGFPTTDETILFERLAMEIMQAGLSWLLILKKRQSLNAAFANFNVNSVANFDQDDINRLLKDETIIRNQLKIKAVIENAKRILAMRDTDNGFSSWIAANHPLQKADWIKLFKDTFRFTGDEITSEFLMSIGYLPGSHHEKCPVSKIVKALNPAWRDQIIDFYK
jgi:DNA-3-methyladenine glycosylase I